MPATMTRYTAILRTAIATAVIAAVPVAAAVARPVAKQAEQAVELDAEPAPPTDCSAAVGFGANGMLPGYVVPDAQLGTVCVPFTPVPPRPAGYDGDYYVTEF
jgi:hypothetical protein